MSGIPELLDANLGSRTFCVDPRGTIEHGTNGTHILTRLPSPKGTAYLSPAFQRWVSVIRVRVPPGTAYGFRLKCDYTRSPASNAGHGLRHPACVTAPGMRGARRWLIWRPLRDSTTLSSPYPALKRWAEICCPLRGRGPIHSIWFTRTRTADRMSRRICVTTS